MWMTLCTGSARGGFGGFWRKSVELRFRPGRGRTDLCAAGAAQSWELDTEWEGSTFGVRRGQTRWGGGRWKRQNRKNVYLSPYVEEPLNSKVIKSFVPELRSRKCFSCFGISMFYVIYVMNILCTFHVVISWPCNMYFSV